MKKKIAIIGAGVGGMAAAYDLARCGDTVILFEASDQVGGLSSGFKDANWEWSVEKYYHHWFASDKYMFNFINELGWSDRIILRRPFTVMYHEGKFYPFDSILKAILFPGLGWGVRKLRFGLVGLYLKLTNNWLALEKHTVAEWLCKWAGDSVYRIMWEPLLIGKFGERYSQQVNMAWMWARLKSRTTRLASYQGGFQAFADQLAGRIQEMGVQIRLSTPVSNISALTEGGLQLQTPNGSESFNQCLVTTSPALLARLAPDLPPQYLKGLLDLKSMGAVAMVLALKNPLSREGYYWYNIPKSAGFPFLALVEHTNFLPSERFGGDHIVYIGDYLESDHEYFQLTKDELLARFLPALTRINSDFSPDWVRASWLFRTGYAQPVPLLNHSKNIPPIQTPIPELYFASMSQVYPWDRGMNYAVHICREAVKTMSAARK